MPAASGGVEGTSVDTGNTTSDDALRLDAGKTEGQDDLSQWSTASIGQKKHDR